MFDQEALDADLAVIGHVVTSRARIPRGEVRVRDGRIVAVLDNPSDAPAAERIDAGDAWVMPGVVDPHVHCLSHAGEGVEAATRSAAAGGVTTLLEMPFDETGPVWSAEAFRAKRDTVRRETHVDIGMYATVEPGGSGLDTVGELAALGAACFKLSTFHTDPLRFPRTPDGELLDAFDAIAGTGLRVCVHAENDEIVQRNLTRMRNTDDSDPLLHGASRPPVTETAAVAAVLEMARATGVDLHFCHISTPHAVDLVQWHRDRGTSVTTEVCPHYLALTEQDMARSGAQLKFNPPLRAPGSTGALRERALSGAIDMIASDHAPWPLEKKQRDHIFDNASGGPGVETLLPVAADAALRHHADPRALVRSVSTRAARAFGLHHRKGDLRPGLDADLVVLDPDTAWTVDGTALHSRAGWSPFDGRTLRAAVQLTVSRGDIIWDGASVLSTPGRGHLLTPAAAHRQGDG
ncbi:dihydroorotase [Streptomyces sp. TR06-5]|uniref:dihydroorotase n=1 Tax=unclassified Streptomyces TaxID=2593676 RepID=UPI0039A2D466